jgi:HPt (histidine-containing phosphotransfer) domain-containing protein
LALSFLYIALGIGALVVALMLALVLLRLNHTLLVFEQALVALVEEMRETLPEVRGSLGNVNDITAGVNLALRTGGRAASRSRRTVVSLASGVEAAGRSLWRSLVESPAAGQQGERETERGHASGQ